MLLNTIARCFFLSALLMLVSLKAGGQQSGQISGKVSMKETGGPLHGARVLIVELGRSTLSDDDGSYEFNRVPPGNYHVVAHLGRYLHRSSQCCKRCRGGQKRPSIFF